MELQRIRLFILLAIFAVGVILYGEWQKEHPPVVPSSSMATQVVESGQDSVPEGVEASPQSNIQESLNDTHSSEWISVATDVLNIKIDPRGGDIVFAELLDYPQSLGVKEGEILVEKGRLNQFIPQTGLVGRNDLAGPDSKQKGRARYQTTQTHYSLQDNDDLHVELTWHEPNGLSAKKIYSFKKGSYVVDVRFEITNHTSSSWQGNMYGLIKEEYSKGESSGMLGLQTYQGGAVSTPEKPYKKVSFSDMTKKPFRQQMTGGWVAMVKHYFLCAFIPDKNLASDYYSRVEQGNMYSLIVTTPVEVAAHSTQTISSQLYVGPEKADLLKSVAPGLELTIDYGILWPISLALLALLKWIHSFIGNWGWSIILVTVVIKLLFYKLSAASYRSMGKMRNLQPKMDALKEKYGEDRQGFSVAIMDLYRKEKINPLGGCLPILIQIPVFIALYYVLLESIELRQAPFMLWIQDLSAKDPYYVLPLIMGATMFLQQKMNPAPPDPMQAKIMMLMPLIFTVLFLSFPSGLVLYWTANNILSILQQWYITKTLGTHSAVPTKKRK